MQDEPPIIGRTYHGVVSEDPAAGPVPDQTRFSFLAQTFTFSGPTGEQDTQDWSAFNGILLELTVQTPDGDEFHIDGSACILGCGVAVTAAHTLHQYMSRLVGGTMFLMCVGVLNERLILWHCHALTHTSNPDMVLLGLTLRSTFPSDMQFYMPAISVYLPAVGSMVSIAGFRAEAPDGVFSKQNGSLASAGRLKVSRGPVTAVFPVKRDDAHLTWPCIEIDTRSSGGVSGGPVFSEEEFLIGVLCSSLSYEDGGGTSYASLIWPALIPYINIDWPKGAYTEKQSLYNSKAVVLEGKECFGAVEGTGVVQTRLRTRP